MVKGEIIANKTERGVGFLEVNKDFFMNDLGLQFFSSDQAFVYWELGGKVSQQQTGIAQRKIWMISKAGVRGWHVML